jgi:hypothetical protein
MIPIIDGISFSVGMISERDGMISGRHGIKFSRDGMISGRDE